MLTCYVASGIRCSLSDLWDVPGPWSPLFCQIVVQEPATKRSIERICWTKPKVMKALLFFKLRSRKHPFLWVYIVQFSVARSLEGRKHRAHKAVGLLHLCTRASECPWRCLSCLTCDGEKTISGNSARQVMSTQNEPLKLLKLVPIQKLVAYWWLFLGENFLDATLLL
jgi:hypothetical protein